MRSRSTFELATHADPRPDLVVERGPSGAGVGWWVPQMKHTYLAKYIDATRKAQVKFPKRVLIDPFCGPGRIQVRGESDTRDGGAMVAWRQSQSSQCPFTTVLVGDIDAERTRACAARLSALDAPVQAFEGAADDTVTLMVDAVPKGALCLAYIDPYNLEYLSFANIQALARLPYIDFAVHFSLMDLTRNVDMELDPARDRFSGACPGWRDRVPTMELAKGGLPAWFFDDWRRQVASLGFKVSEVMPLIEDDQGRALYRLVFFSRHTLPDKIWGDIAKSRNRSLDFG